MKSILFFLSLFVLLSCHSQSGSDFAPEETRAAFDMSAEGDYSVEQEKSMLSNTALAFNDEQKEEDRSEQQQKPLSKSNNKKIIRTANMTLEVSNYKESREMLNSILQKYDAFIASEQEQNQTWRLENNLTIRLLPEHLDAFIKDVEGLALNVYNKTISAKDVTKEFLDLEIRLKTKREVIARYQALLKQARNVQEVLAVEAQLRQVIEEVESVEGQLKYLRDEVGFSTVHLNMYQKLERPAYQKPGFFTRLASSFGDGWTGFLEFVLGVAMLWPFWLVLVVVIFIIRRWRRRKKA